MSMIQVFYGVFVCLIFQQSSHIIKRYRQNRDRQHIKYHLQSAIAGLQP